MTLRLYDTRRQALVDFEPLVPGRVGLYVCGPTVQSSPHIGHLRSALVYDLWRRWFTHRGLEVTLVRNVTDVDDKILALSAGTDEEWWARAYRYELEFTAGYDALGVLPPTYEPRATASIGEMQAIVGRLLDAGHAYVADDGSGDVWFDTVSWPDYGVLTRQAAGDVAPSADTETRGKRDPRDFALWKGRKPEEPASANWPSPWGEGRPGWHVECSAMSRRYLGAEFDLHGGGLDLRFPHHENELAQSTAAGDGFARHWLHNGLVAVEGQKMSKSLGNSVFAADLLAAARPVVVRYFLSSAHYRSTIDYHDGALDEAEAALDRVETFLVRARRRLADTRFAATGARVVPDAFAEAMDDDLSTPQALAVLHDAVRSGNTALDEDDLETAAREWQHVQAMTAVLGVDPTAPEWKGATDDAAHRALGVLADVLLAERRRARADRDFARADEIRAQLTSAGITIEDTPSGSHWSLEQ